MSVNKQQELIKKINLKQKELDELNTELNLLQKDNRQSLDTSKHSEVVQQVKSYFDSHFRTISTHAEKGSFNIDDERYILMRSSSMSYDFFKSIYKLYREEKTDDAFQYTSDLLYDVANLLGKEDAKRFLKKLHIKDAKDKLKIGPLHFEYTGWAKVELFPESNLVEGDNFYLRYRHHNSFEADAWISNNETSENGVCIMSAGYSAGWVEECYKTKLVAIEVSCRAAGDEYCEFVMAPPHRIYDYIKEDNYKLPSFSSKKRPLYMTHQALKEKLFQREKLLQNAQRIAKMGTFYYDVKNQELSCSNELASIFELTHQDKNNILTSYLNTLHQKDRKELTIHYNNTLKNKKSFDFNHTIRTPNGTIKWLDSKALPILNSNKELIAIEGCVQDVSDRVIQGRELNAFFNLSVDLQCVATVDGFFLRVSSSWCKLLGYTREEICNSPYISFIHPEDIEKTKNEVENIFKTSHTFSFKNRYIKKDGSTVLLEWNARFDKATNLIYCTARDVTSEEKIKDELLKNIKDKEILLKEVHHRVKNNLQIISSLLSLQSNLKAVKNPHLKKLYEDSQNRIKAMSAIHELFYKSSTDNKVNFKTYLEKLILDLIYSFCGEKNNIKLNQEIEPVFLSLDIAVPLGLIINEIITNSLKHGLPKSGIGEISINMSKNNTSLGLHIKDNGDGIPTPINENEIVSLGMTIIYSLIEQLDGEIKLDTTSKGTQYRIIIPLKN